MNLNKITVIGRDNRITVAKALLAENGYTVEHVISRDALSRTDISDIILLPIPYKDALGRIKGTDITLNELAPRLTCDNYIILGKADGDITSLSDIIGFGIFDINEDLRFKKLNAIPTAEAALGIAMQNTFHTMYGHSAIVCGYGCIAQALARLLVNMGVNVTVCARKHADRIDAEYHGCSTIDFPQLAECIASADMVFNTCPARVIGAKELDKVKDGCILIDLASRPGGIDHEYAKAHGINSGLYLSLPDIYSPRTSGENLYKMIHATVTELRQKGA
ncbi:MAG: hypothetical protein J6L92_06035 [Clostridia bacterium]|nr:hypothetical protein [Clostridia bacterium]